jgi:hypothetical protein
MAKSMKKLGARNYALISSGVKALGSYNPDEILFMFEEQLYVDQYEEIIAFLKWVHENHEKDSAGPYSGFGSGNYEKVFAEFKKSKE